MVGISTKTYEILPQEDSTFSVCVSDGEFAPTVVAGFRTEVEVDKWILDQRRSNLRKLIDKLQELGTAPARRVK